MDTRVQFRVNEETKRLAQQMTESQGRTLIDACRELAEQQRKTVSHDTWLSEQVNLAFEKFDTGQSVFIEHDEAKLRMIERKAKIRSRLLIIPEVSMIVSYWVDNAIIRVMRVLHQKQKFPMQ